MHSNHEEQRAHRRAALLMLGLVMVVVVEPVVSVVLLGRLPVTIFIVQITFKAITVVWNGILLTAFDFTRRLYGG